MTDADREKLIAAYQAILKLEDSHDIKLTAAARMGELIGGRSPEQGHKSS